MENEEIVRDWNNEVKELKEQLEFLNIGSGTHKIVFLDNGSAGRLVEYADGKSAFKVDFKIEYKGVQKVWSITKGDNPTTRSLWGQVAKYAALQGTLVGKEVTIIVKGEGTSKDYTVVEAAQIE